jgi:hypothetical protein
VSPAEDQLPLVPSIPETNRALLLGQPCARGSSQPRPADPRESLLVADIVLFRKPITGMAAAASGHATAAPHEGIGRVVIKSLMARLRAVERGEE